MNRVLVDLFHKYKRHLSVPSHVYIAYFQGLVHIFLTPCLRVQIRYRLRLAGSCQWADSISALAHYQHYPHYTRITNVATFQHYHAGITSISWMECAQVQVSTGIFPHGVCHMRRGRVCTCDTRQGTWGRGMGFVYRIWCIAYGFLTGGIAKSTLHIQVTYYGFIM